MNIKKLFVWYAKFTALTFPLIAALYIPYNVFWLKYTFEQLEKWLLTAGIMFALSGLITTPYYAYVFRKIGVKPNA